MQPKQNILAFDTSAAHVAAALLSGGALASSALKTMKKGQAEALFEMLEEHLPMGGWSGLDAIAVGIGPGNFTGIRISVSAARGLGLSLDIPVIGVSNFDVALHESRFDSGWVSLPAPRDQIYLRAFKDAEALDEPFITNAADFVPPNGTENLPFVGHKADELAARYSGEFDTPEISNPAASIALIASDIILKSKDKISAPAPLYARPADASLPKEPPVTILP